MPKEGGEKFHSWAKKRQRLGGVGTASAEERPRALGARGPVYAETDSREQAVSWRSSPAVRAATQLLATLPYRYGNRMVHYSAGSGSGGSISMRDMAFAFELSMGDVGNKPRMLNAAGDEPAVGGGVAWWGVGSQQSALDSAMIHDMIWRVKPDLLIEIGTWCGGGAIMYAKEMLEYNPDAKVYTVDPANPDRRWECTQLPGSKWYESLNPFGMPGVQSPYWASLKASGGIVSLTGSALGKR